MSKTYYPQSADLGAYLYSAGLVSAPPSATQAILGTDDALASAVALWERETGWVPFLTGSSQTRYYDPPGPEKGPIGIYFGVNNVGGSRNLFLKAGLRSVTSLYVGKNTTSTSITGTVSGTVTANVFTGTLTAAFGTGTFTGTGTGTITGVGSTTLTITSFSATGSSVAITGTTAGNPTGTCTGSIALTGTTNSLGTALVQNIDFWLRPLNATNYDRPYTSIEFAFPQWGSPQSIAVTGAFGFGTTVPDDAWLAILKMSALELIPSLQVAQFGGLLKWQDADASEQYREKPFQPIIDQWQAQIAPVIARYKRKIMA